MSSGSGLPLNLGYAKTRAGMFKCIAVAIGLLAWAFLLAAYDEGGYYHEHTSRWRVKFDPEEHCKARLKEAKAWNEHLPEGQKIKIKECPFSWLFVPPTFIIMVIWLVTFVLCVAMLLLNFNATGFGKIDGIIHLVCGIIVLVLTLAIIGFVVMVFIERPCTEDDSNSSLSPHGRSATPSPKGQKRSYGPVYTAGMSKEDYCAAERKWYYRPVLIIIGVIFAIPAGIMYILAGILSMRGGAMGPGRPMMMGGPQAYPSQQATMVQQSPSQNQQSVRASPSARTNQPEEQ